MDILPPEQSSEISFRITNLSNYIQKHNRKREIVLFKRALKDILSGYFSLKRQSGSPVVLHSLRVAEMLTGFSLHPKFVIAGLIHDLQEDTEFSNTDICIRYGNWFADVVEALTKEDNQTNTHDKLLTACFNEPGIILIKLCDRLDNLREISFLPKKKQKRIKMETRSFYIPLLESPSISPHIQRAFSSFNQLT